MTKLPRVGLVEMRGKGTVEYYLSLNHHQHSNTHTGGYCSHFPPLSPRYQSCSCSGRDYSKITSYKSYIASGSQVWCLVCHLHVPPFFWPEGTIIFQLSRPSSSSSSTAGRWGCQVLIVIWCVHWVCQTRPFQTINIEVHHHHHHQSLSTPRDWM